MDTKKFFLIVGCVLLLSLSSFFGVIMASSLFDKSNTIGDLNPVNPDTIEYDEEGNVMDVYWEDEDGTVIHLTDENLLDDPPQDRVNVLLLGLDMGDYRSDSIMLVSLDNRNKTAALLSIPRDTVVMYNGNADKINHLVGYSGSYMNTIQAVKSITGLNIHYYAIINFAGFENIIDILGGVEIDVPFNMYYNDLDNNQVYSLQKGLQKLNGHDAVGFMRYRSGYATADLGRVEAQRTLISELIKQKLNIGNILKAPQLFEEMQKFVKTNYSLGDVAAQAMTLKDLKVDEIQSFTLPGEPKEAYIRSVGINVSVYQHWPNATEKLIDEYFRTKMPEDLESSLPQDDGDSVGVTE